jgi:hypothetical protein
VSLPCPCPITTPTAVTERPPTATRAKNARHPPAAESDQHDAELSTAARAAHARPAPAGRCSCRLGVATPVVKGASCCQNVSVLRYADNMSGLGACDRRRSSRADP